MKHLMILLATLVCTSSAFAQEFPPVPEGGFLNINNFACSDNQSGQKGHCLIKQDMTGQKYLIFTQNREVMFIRTFGDDGHETIWMRDSFNTF